MSKIDNVNTRSLHSRNWRKFAKWAVTTINSLTEHNFFTCSMDEVDDAIRTDFVTMNTAMFLDKYKDMLTKYLVSISHLKNNTQNAYMTSVKSFFTSESVSIKLPKGKIPSIERARGDHELTIPELQAMWHVGNWEEKARISTALSLGWGISDFMALQVNDIKAYLHDIDEEGFCVFDSERIKTRRRSVIVIGILNPDGTRDLTKYLDTIPDTRASLWTIGTPKGMNLWLRTLYAKAGFTTTRKLHFHCF
jgi:hypothetical protein